jgi:hypothetical protein
VSLEKKLSGFRWVLVTALLAGCVGEPDFQPLYSFSISDMSGLKSREGITFEPDISSDGTGSLRLEAADTTTFRLYEIGALDLEDALLTFNADLRSEDLQGQALLEIIVRTREQGEYFMRSYASPLTGTNDWSARKTGYLLRKGERPDRVQLNVVVLGTGTVWIDAIVLAKEKKPAARG